MKKFFCVLTALALLFSLSISALTSENLFENGDFSLLDGDMPQGWKKDMWLTDTGISKLYVDENGYEGSCIAVVNVDENDARFVQTVSVKPETTYRISAMVKAENCTTGGYGANLSIDGLFTYSDAVYDTAGQWQPVEFYGVTGENQTELTVFARVGGYSGLCTGRAWFDNLEITEVEDVPFGTEVHDFFKAESTKSSTAAPKDEGEPERHTEAFLLGACVYAIAVMGFVRKRGRAPLPEDYSFAKWLAVGLISAFIVRIVIAMRVRGYNTDINCFHAWSERMLAMGPFKFYSPDYFCDYPPGYMLMLLPAALLRSLFNLTAESPVYLAILKMLPILCDIAGAWLVFHVLRKKCGGRSALFMAMLYAFNPAAIANCAAWGQIDAVLTLLIVLCALFAGRRRYIGSLILFVCALLIKPQALLFAPLGLAAMIFGILSSGKPMKRLKQFAIGLIAALGILYAVSFVFCIGRSEGFPDMLTLPVRWLIELYSGTMEGYKYVTVNALNLYVLMGLNWAKAADHTTVITVAWILFGLSYAYSIVLSGFSRKKPMRIFLTGGLLIMLICTFGPMIHERYIFPAMLLLALAYGTDRDKRILISLTALTATLFLNEVLVLQGGMTAANYGHLNSGENWLNYAVCILNILNALFLSWTAFDICVLNRVWAMAEPETEEMPMGVTTLEEKSDWKLNLRRAEIIAMCAVTLVYSVVAFVNLGTLKAPETGWTSSISGESVVFDLGETRSFRMAYYGGVCNTNFTVELSDDGQIWSPPHHAKYNQGEIFRWLWYVPLDESDTVIYQGSANAVPSEEGAPATAYASSSNDHPFQTARYVRITAESAGLTLFEVAFLDENGIPLPILGIDQTGFTEDVGNAALLGDEQDTVAEYPSYFNSSYFDEIYHARTAYEHLHGMNAYEWTHPPLGKVTMMLGVALFGMNPFGWRFMGALVGVLMVPLMYLLVRQLTRSSKLSFIAMCLMALDSMHFTQTRIATIDSYAVFWIMLMYLFMFRYCRMNWNRVSLKRTLVPLGLCGITMGVAWATKWIGIYASAGLAILFFWTLYRRLREYLCARRLGTSDEATPDFWRNTLITIGFCLVFFVLVPVLIYYFSYYWHLKGEGLTSFWGMFDVDRIKRVIRIQENIFGYHSGLGSDTHYFRSPWYQWPIIWWPMWYYSGTAYMPEGMISSISCMGNPAVWWFGLIALIFILVRMCWLRRAPKAYVMVIIAFASQFLPWVLVPRSTFIYHYFASVPFIIIASVLMLDWLRRRSEKAFSISSIVLLTAALVLFIMFYPLESGMPAARSYAQCLRWFKWYNF
ncbi:MAG: phospholipid carrier-dependent glycosyltransferase [Clostridia bacterium]|nr:phospholipid carrier-dependent glycosyltransferase [Clostridia bacterium]